MYSLRPEGFELVVSDEGEGFDRQQVRDPLAAENRARAGGRGLFLMERLMDEVRYEDGGSTIVLRKGDASRLRTAPAGDRIREPVGLSSPA